MNSPSLSVPDSTSARPSPPDPVVFVVDDDISVREALELLILCTGARVETFASAEEFLLRERPGTPSCGRPEAAGPSCHPSPTWPGFRSATHRWR